MRNLNAAEVNLISGAGTDKLTAADITAMMEAGYSGSQIAKIGLKTATEERAIDFGNNVAGDAGYTLSDNGGPLPKVTRWFFDGAGYVFG